MTRKFLALPVAAIAFALSASPASAATCSDYDTQAQAQRAADTIDADNDGIYCETLPCPCLRPGEGGGGGGGGDDDPAPRPREPKPRAQRIDARITDVVDGDTIKVRAWGAKRKHYTVRLLGIDTPETVDPNAPVECGGPEATSLHARPVVPLARSTRTATGCSTRRAARAARSSCAPTRRRTCSTSYDRLLAYVIPAGRTMLQRRMLAAGWATTYVFDKPFREVSEFRRLERGARPTMTASTACATGTSTWGSSHVARRAEPQPAPGVGCGLPLAVVQRDGADQRCGALETTL